MSETDKPKQSADPDHEPQTGHSQGGGHHPGKDAPQARQGEGGEANRPAEANRKE